MNFHLLGQVMVDKNPGITSAVNKTSNIDNTYRNFQMEVLCGEENMLTKVLHVYQVQVHTGLELRIRTGHSTGR